MKKTSKNKSKSSITYVSRREFFKVISGVLLFGLSYSTLAQAEDMPAEPENLDEPTIWQEGDPEPKETTVPATEPEQTSYEDPPSQPMDDDRGEQPDTNHKWVNGYWWWSNNQYVWVSGYWSVPPQSEYVYIPGYWNYAGTSWIYVRGGWGVSNTTTVVVHANPRPVLTLFVITAPLRIIRRNRRWRHYPSRRRRHRPHTSRHRNLKRKGPSKGPSRGPSKGPSKGPSRGPSKGPSRGPSKGPSKGPSRGSSKGPSRGSSAGPNMRR